jgi:hypothetical protein
MVVIGELSVTLRAKEFFVTAAIMNARCALFPALKLNGPLI